jgi:hypothetical protein
VDATTQQLGLFIIVLTMVITIVVTQFVRVTRNRTYFRTIPAYAALPDYIAFTIEANRPLHLSFGSTGLSGPTTVLTLASAELFYQIAQRAAIGDVSPIITMTNPTTFPLGQDVLRRAWQSRDRVQNFRYRHARWFPYTSRSLAYAAAITTLQTDDAIGANIYAGDFGAELALMMEAGLRRNIPEIGVTTSLEGQAVAYAMSNHILIGEEVFAAGAYLGAGSTQTGATITVDILRWLTIAALIGAFILALRNGAA